MHLPRFLSLVVIVLAFSLDCQSQQLASLHPDRALVWQQTSPSRGSTEGPVLYQLLLNGSGMPGTVPVFDSNPRHLANSPITVNGGLVAIGPFSINGGSGIVSFANGQTFPGVVNSVTAGNGFITIGGTGGNPTVSFNTVNGDGRYLTLNGGTMAGKITFAAGQTFPGSGSVTSVATGAGLTGGPITGSGTISILNGGVSNAMLANPSLTINGSGINGGGTVALGGTLTLTNAGLLSLGVTAPLSSTGGQNPSLTLSTVPIAKGGTGITTGPTATGQYLRSTAAGAINWGDIVVSDLPSLSGTYVDLSSAQTISGNKTFTGNLIGNTASFTGGTFTGLTISGNLSGNSATFTGNVSGNNASYTGGTFTGLTISGNLSGNTASFTGNVSGNNASYTGGTFTGNLSGNTASFTGNASFGGGLLLPAVQSATGSGGFASNSSDYVASSFNSAAGTAVNQRFRWQAEPVGNNTGTASGSLNLLFSAGNNPVAETGLSVNSGGIISFAPGQTFPGSSGGTVTQVNTGAGLTGGPITSSGTVSIPAAGVTNAMLQNSSLTINGGSGLSGGGTLSLGGSTTLSVGFGAVTNSMLQNPAVTVNTGSGISGGGTLTLGGSLTLNNTGLLSLSAAAPLSATAGQNPALTLSGTVGIAHGGTGITTGPSAAGQYLRSSGAGAINWGDIVAGDLPSLSGTYVDLTTAQSIGGNKTFTGNATFTNAISGNLTGNASDALALGGNLASLFSTTAQNDARYLQLSGGTLTGNLNGTGASFTGNISGNNAAFNGGTFTGGLTTSIGGAGTVATFTNLAGGQILSAQVQAAGTPAPSEIFSINGDGRVALEALGTATAATPGFNSGALEQTASVFAGTPAALHSRNFFWQAEPGDVAAGSLGELHLLFSNDAAAATETGLTINGDGKITFANGQTFPGSVTSVTAGDGTITIGGTGGAPTVAVGTIAAGNIRAGQVVKGLNGLTDGITLSGTNGLSVNAGAGTLTLTSNATANNTANDIVSRDANGSFSAGSITLSGDLSLPNTASASVGVINFGGAPFISNFGPLNTFVGAGAGNLAMTGDRNSAFGAGALQKNTTSEFNSAFGAGALQNNVAAFSYNSAFGTWALLQNTTGCCNNAFGSQTMQSNTIGQLNSAFGGSALRSNISGNNNSAFGDAALESNTINSGNSAFGYSALLNNNDPTIAGNASNNSAFGINTLSANTTASGNSAFGASALQANTSGGANSAFGLSALAANTTNSFNSAFGSGALQFNTGCCNNAFGSQTLQNNSTGTFNDAFGGAALTANTMGSSNDAFGDRAPPWGAIPPEDPTPPSATMRSALTRRPAAIQLSASTPLSSTAEQATLPLANWRCKTTAPPAATQPSAPMPLRPTR